MKRRAFLTLAAAAPALAAFAPLARGAPRTWQIESPSGVWLTVHALEDLRLKPGDYRLMVAPQVTFEGLTMTMTPVPEVRPFAWAPDKFVPSGLLVNANGLVCVSQKDIAT